MKIIPVIMLLLLSFGCARTVTPVVSYGQQMLVEVTLRGGVDSNNNRYFLVVSSNAGYKVPLPLPDVDQDAPECIEPGLTPLLGTAEAYYNKFFSTWSGYLALDRAQYYIVKGPFIINQTVTRESLSGQAQSVSKFSFTWQLERIFGTAIPDQIYFDLVTVPWQNGVAKIPVDHLTSTNAYVSKVTGSIANIYDGEDSSIDANLDIVNCRVEIQ